MEMRCYGKILHISYHVTNEEVFAKIQQAIGPHEDLMTVIKRRKLQWYGHVSHSSDLAKTILQGTVKGRRRQGGQRRGWKTTSGNGQAWSSASPRGQWRTGKNGENWLQNHLWCPNGPRGYGIVDVDVENVSEHLCSAHLIYLFAKFLLALLSSFSHFRTR